MAILNDFIYYKKFTFDTTADGANVSSDQSNFPVCIHINSSSWPNATERSHWVSTYQGGKRVQFFDSAGNNLAYEVEYFDNANEAIYWVKVPTITGNTNTSYIVMGYGNDPNGTDQDAKTSVWDSNFAAVYHIGDNSWGSVPEAKDSTSNAKNATNHGTDDVSGIVRRGRTWVKANSDYLDVPDIVGTAYETYTFWINITAFDTTGLALAELDGFEHYFYNGELWLSYGNWSSGWSKGAGVVTSSGTWTHVGVVRNNLELKWYKNGALVSTQSMGASAPTRTFKSIGKPVGTHYLDASLDEFRFSKNTTSAASRSADWIKLEYYTTKKTNYNGDTGTSGTNYPVVAHGSEALVIAADFVANKTNFYVNQQAGFVDLSKAGTSWVWEYNKDGAGWVQFSTSKNPNYTFPGNGTYSIRFTVNNGADQEIVTKTDYLKIGITTFTLCPIASAYPLSYPPQCGVWFDGQFIYVLHYPENGTNTSTPKMVYVDTDSASIGSVHTLSGGTTTVNRGYKLSSWYTFKAGYGAYTSFCDDGSGSANTRNFALNYKTDGNLNTSGVMETVNSGDPLTGYAYPNTCISGADSIYISATKQGAGRSIYFTKSTVQSTLANGFDSKITVKTLSSDNAMSQLLPWYNSDTGILYTDGNSLFYKHWDYSGSSLGNEETIATDIGAFNLFRGGITDNGKLFVAYREQTTGKLRGRVRTGDVGGTWGSVFDIATDLYGADTTSYFTITSDVGHPERVQIFYYDGTDIVNKVYDTGSIGSKNSLVTVTLANEYIKSPFAESSLIPVVYSVGTNLKVYAFTIIPEERSDSGYLASINIINSGYVPGDRFAYKYNDLVVVLIPDKSHRPLLNIWDTVSKTWLYTWWAVDIRRWDTHNMATFRIGDDGHIYVVLGGRSGHNTTTNLIVYKSTYALTDSNFSVGSWVDISPAPETGRGYKYFEINAAGHIYLVTGDTTGFIWYIREYYNGTWYSKVTIISISYPASYDYAYIGEEAWDSDNNCMHLYWTWRDNTYIDAETYGTNIAVELSYMKIVPQGAGAFKLYKADGSELTAPCSQINRDLVYNGVSGNYWLSVATAVVMDGYDSVVSIVFYDKTPVGGEFPVVKVQLAAWISSSWTFRDSMGYAVYIDSNSNYYTLGSESIGGINQLKQYQSVDKAITWDEGFVITNSPVSIGGAFSQVITKIVVSQTNNFYKEWRFFDSLAQAKPAEIFRRWWERQRKKSRTSGRIR